MKRTFSQYPEASVRSMRIGAPGRMHAVQNVELVWANVQRRLMLIRFTGPGGTIELQVSLTPAQMLADWLTEETTNRPFIAEILDEERRQYMAKQKRKIAKQRARLG